MGQEEPFPARRLSGREGSKLALRLSPKHLMSETALGAGSGQGLALYYNYL